MFGQSKDTHSPTAKIKTKWSSALCLVTGGFDDKAWEISQMPLIYQGAAVTFVASQAGDVHEGFLHDRHTSAA